MRFKILLFLIVLLPFLAYSQGIKQENVPAVVLNAFQLKYASATDNAWRLENGNYQVKFRLNEKENKLLINDKGIIVKHHQNLYESEIPKSVLETIKTKLSFFDIDDAELSNENGRITYNIYTEINGKDAEFIIDEKGALLKYERELRFNEVPSEIKSIINSRFGLIEPDDVILSEGKTMTTYSIKGEINDSDHFFEFDGTYKLLKHGRDLRESEIPKPVLTAVQTNYSGFEIRDADRWEIEGIISYHLQLRRSRESVLVRFNSSGNILENKKP